jgi:hypothetical protein
VNEASRLEYNEPIPNQSAEDRERDRQIRMRRIPARLMRGNSPAPAPDMIRIVLHRNKSCSSAKTSFHGL